MMRRPVPQKLLLRRDIVRQLGHLELARVASGDPALAYDSGVATCPAPAANAQVSLACHG